MHYYTQINQPCLQAATHKYSEVPQFLYYYKASIVECLNSWFPLYEQKNSHSTTTGVVFRKYLWCTVNTMLWVYVPSLEGSVLWSDSFPLWLPEDKLSGIQVKVTWLITPNNTPQLPTALFYISDDIIWHLSKMQSLNREKGVKCQLADLNRSTWVRLSTRNSGYLGRQWRSTHWHLCDRTLIGWMPILLAYSGSLKKPSAGLHCSIHHQHLDQLLGIAEVIEISF